jgi:hypothetical protein
MTTDMMDTDIAMQVLHAQSVQLGDNAYAAQNSDRKSFVYKIFTRFEFGHDDVKDSKTIRFRFMALGDAIVTASQGDSDSIYLSTPDGKRIDPQSSPTDPDVFLAYANIAIVDGHQSSASTTVVLHSDLNFSALHSRIRQFLMTNKVFIKPNHSATSLEEIVRVAVIPFVHPDVTFRKGFSAELNVKLQDVVNVKNSEFKSRYPCITADFRIEVLVRTGQQQMRFKRGSVSCPILMVESPKSQAVLCRIILQEALDLMSPFDAGPSSYYCIPLVLRDAKKYPKGPAMFFNLLKQHQQFLQEFKVFQLKGIHRFTMAILRPKIITECSAIKAIEPTFQTDEFGKWNICSTQAKFKEAQAWIDSNLQTILDNTAIEDKPSVPALCPPHRIIDYAAISDSQVESLYALSGISVNQPPPVNAWGTPHLIAPTQAPPTFSTLSASQTTINELRSELKDIKTTLASHDATLNDPKNKTNLSAETTDQITEFIQDQIIDMTSSLHSEFEEYIDDLKDEIHKQSTNLSKQSSQISGILSKVEAQDARFVVLETTISNQFAPLNDAILGGGLLKSLREFMIQPQPATQLALPAPQPMDEDIVHTPRRLFDIAISESPAASSGKKRNIRPSPFSRRGQPSPLRVRRDHPVSSSPSKSKHL